MASLNMWQFWMVTAILISLYGMCSGVGIGKRRVDGGKSRVSIVGGTAAEGNKWPMYALLHILKDAETGEVGMCGGAVIAPRWILTASHCLTSPDASVYYALVGNYNRTGLYLNDFPRAEQIFKHPNYREAAQGDDIALIYLEKPLEYSNSIQPVDLPTADPEVGTTCTVMGFGTMKFETLQVSSVLMEVNVPVVSNEICQQGVSSKILSSHLCAGETGKDSCQGDSGGPLICKNSANNKYEIPGVVSVGAGCGKEGSPGVYARVSSYLSWIDEVMKSQPN